jgi:hypothetical protein
MRPYLLQQVKLMHEANTHTHQLTNKIKTHLAQIFK